MPEVAADKEYEGAGGAWSPTVLIGAPPVFLRRPRSLGFKKR